MKIAILGFGTVGSGVAEVLDTNKALITQRAGEEIEVKYVLDLRDFPGQKIQEKIVHDYDVIADDPEIKVVVEVMGGVEPANTFVKRALLAGKSVVTSNKALVAKCGADLLKTAREKKVNFLFEASVGGGIPILRALGVSLTADEIEEITGILNGTTNYMMTKMFYEGADYRTVLKEAQQNGYAEADPTADVEGYDACRKIAILASIISGKQVDFEDIYTEGITKVTSEDMKYAKAMGMTIKLLAKCIYRDGKISAGVAPCLLPAEHPLYSVNDVFNAVFVRGNMLGDAMFYGSGAGKLPTASAVVSDVIAAVKNPDKDIMNFWSEEKQPLVAWKDTKKRFLVRVKGDWPEKDGEVRKVFGGDVVFVETEERLGECGFVTPVMTEEAYQEKAETFDGILHMIRIEED
ncbi:MAG: homoserine dehydrogenase [Coprococcus sp.]|nr:homoserine dehydrogenase [Coprococcus sp.]